MLFRSARALEIYAIQLFTWVRLPHPVKIISIIGRSNLVWSSEWISLRVKTSTSVLSYVSTNGRGKRCVLFQLLDGTTVSPPKSHFCFRVFLLFPDILSYSSMRPCPFHDCDDHRSSSAPASATDFLLPASAFAFLPSGLSMRSLPSRSYAPFPQGSFPDDDLLHPLMSAFASVLVSSSIRNFRLIAFQRRRLTFPLALLQMIRFLSSDFPSLERVQALGFAVISLLGDP